MLQHVRTIKRINDTKATTGCGGCNASVDVEAEPFLVHQNFCIVSLRAVPDSESLSVTETRKIACAALTQAICNSSASQIRARLKRLSPKSEKSFPCGNPRRGAPLTIHPDSTLVHSNHRSLQLLISGANINYSFCLASAGHRFRRLRPRCFIFRRRLCYLTRNPFGLPP